MVEKITELNEIQFPKLGWTFRIDPTAFKIGSLEVQWYGLIITLGLILALVYCFPKMKRFGLDADRAIDAVLGGVLGGLVGARLYYVAFNWSEYKDDLKSIFNTREGGLAIYGGIIGALAVGLLICKIRKVKMLPMLDITCLGFLIGQGVGRWGNFVNQEAFGGKTDSFLGMTGGRIQEYIFENSASLGGSLTAEGSGIMNLELYPVHPCFLYESVWCLLGFVLLAFWSKRRKYDGQLLLMYMAWYGAERFVVEGLRSDSLYIGSIRVSQALSAIIFVVSVILQIVMFSRIRRDPERYVLYASTKESRQLIEEGRRRRMGMSAEDAKTSIDDDDDDDFVPDFDDDEDSKENGGSSILGDNSGDDGQDDESEASDDEGNETDESEKADDSDNDEEKKPQE